MTFNDWLIEVKNSKFICERYLPLVDAARSRKQYMDIALDVNGMTFLCDMREKGYGLSYDVMCDEFKAYLNGRYIHAKSTLLRGYTSSMYCRVEAPSEITINTTLTGIFGCRCSVHVPANTYCQLIVDGTSVVNITVGDGGKCYVDLWRGGEATFNDPSSVIVKHKSIEDE